MGHARGDCGTAHPKPHCRPRRARGSLGLAGVAQPGARFIAACAVLHGMPAQREAGSNWRAGAAKKSDKASPTARRSTLRGQTLTGTLQGTQLALEGTRNSPSAQAVQRWLPAPSTAQLVQPGARQRTHCPPSKPKPVWHSTHAAGLLGAQRAQLALQGWQPEGPSVKPRWHAAPAGGEPGSRWQ